MKISRNAFLCMTLLTAGCAPDSPLLKHELTLTEKPGSAALADGLNLARAGDGARAQPHLEEAYRSAEDPRLRAQALMELASLAGEKGDAPRQASLLKEAAALGEAEASFALARMSHAQVAPQTVALLEASAKNDNDASAMLALARLYREGMSGAPDPAKAEGWYRRAVEAGNVAAAIELGRLWAEPQSGKTPAQAMALLSQAATHAPEAAAASIAALYERQGNDTQAVTWYTKAADAPDAGAGLYNALARFYREGRGVARDDKAALYWSVKAARAGSVSATERVMRAYYNGIGTPRDDERGAQWMERLFALKPERIYSLAKDFAEGDGVPPSPAMAVSLAERAAAQGDTRAMKFAAKAYEGGRGVSADASRAAYWYAKAGIVKPERRKKTARAATPHRHPLIAQAQTLEAKGDAAQALTLYRKAAEDGDGEAMLRLAAAYASGSGALQDMAQAAAWYRKAAESGSAEGQYRLGMAYAGGLGVTKDIAQARHWLELAAGNGYPQAMQTLQTLLASTP